MKLSGHYLDKNMSKAEKDLQETILDILRKYIGEEFNAEQVTPTANLEALGIDSMDVVEIIFDLEETFDIDVPDPGDMDDVEVKFDTAQDLVNLVDALIKQKN